MFYFDARHRRVACRNLAETFGDTKSIREINAIAHENFRRIGENICCALKLASMPQDYGDRFVELRLSNSPAAQEALRATNVLCASGHFGSFELFSRLQRHFPQYRLATTHRAIRQPGLDKLVGDLRSKFGLLMFERRDGAEALKKELKNGGLMLVLFADQSDRNNGIDLPFLGRPAYTNRAPAVMATRYDCALFTPICYRVGLGRYLLDIGEPIPTRDESGRRRSCEEITRDINRAWEAAILRDPANWFWVHNRWKRKPQPEPAPVAA